jgi:hypothetical protein
MVAVAVTADPAMILDEAAPLPFALLDDPLAYVLAANLRHRSICVMLRRVATERIASRGEADRITAFLTAELPLHREDEGLDLYPNLRRRALPADELGVTLACLEAEHRQGAAFAEVIAEALSSRPADAVVQIDVPVVEVMQGYAAKQLRSIALENGVVLALARIRLTRPDKRMISRAMKARRGVAEA